jgi:hypothetical protein
MGNTVDDLEAAVLQLPEEGRARLAKTLIQSLEGSPEDSTEQIWFEEADRRYQEIRRGEVEAQDSDEVLREARARRV